MPDRPSQGNRGPVTLVVTRKDDEGGVLSWTFASEDAAMSVIRAFRQDERWMLIRGVYESGALALKAAHRSNRIIIKENRPSGLIRRCDAATNTDDKHRSSA